MNYLHAWHCSAFFLICVLISKQAQSQALNKDDFARETLEWQEANSQKLKKPSGWLALTGHYWLREGLNRIGTLPDSEIKLPDGADASIGAAIIVRGGSVTLGSLSPHRFVCKDAEIRGSLALQIDPLLKEADAEDVVVIENRYRIQLVRRSGRLAIRVRDPLATRLVRFPGKTWFPVDSSFRINATFKAWTKPEETESTNIRGEAIQLDSIGEASFEWNGKSYSLVAQREGDELSFVFKDQTNGVDSYGPGRFLNVKMPVVQPGESTTIILDFNQAYNPPCAFSPHTLCPLAPASNRLPFPIRAGESYLPREKLLERMETTMGPMPHDDRRVELDLKEVSREKLDGYDRIKLTFAAEKGDRVPAWLLIPHSIGKHPAMLCLHQTTPIGKDEPVGLGEQESKRQALHLVKRGYVCLAPDYPSFGEYPYDFEAAFARGDYASGSMKAIWNNRRALDLLCSLPQVDAERIGAIGHSLGGHNALFTAAFDDRIRVVVTSCGFCSFGRYYGGNLKGWTSSRYMPRIASVYHNDPKRVPFDFDDVLMAIFPRAIFVMAPMWDSNFDLEGVKEIVNKVSPSYSNANLENQWRVVHPDAGHDWPETERVQAYEFLDQNLKP